MILNVKRSCLLIIISRNWNLSICQNNNLMVFINDRLLRLRVISSSSVVIQQSFSFAVEDRSVEEALLAKKENEGEEDAGSDSDRATNIDIVESVGDTVAQVEEVEEFADNGITGENREEDRSDCVVGKTGLIRGAVNVRRSRAEFRDGTVVSTLSDSASSACFTSDSILHFQDGHLVVKFVGVATVGVCVGRRSAVVVLFASDNIDRIVVADLSERVAGVTSESVDTVFDFALEVVEVDFVFAESRIDIPQEDAGLVGAESFDFVAPDVKRNFQQSSCCSESTTNQDAESGQEKENEGANRADVAECADDGEEGSQDDESVGSCESDDNLLDDLSVVTEISSVVDELLHVTVDVVDFSDGILEDRVGGVELDFDAGELSVDPVGEVTTSISDDVGDL
jgi:hypothetical protein